MPRHRGAIRECWALGEAADSAQAPLQIVDLGA
jgi:hypothetical protein